MKLTRLELSGFKSFADGTELAFEDGITAIVGPNGCGKSNISDAVRWVLGEQRARLLRSARMDDVIFQGSVKRRPINVADVALVFDNSDGVLPISYHEVVIMRRISRSGQSDYLINQSEVRLRDVADLLQGTGLGSDAGVVIEAQMIDRLLSERAEERRSLFEEAAGIGLYRDRKASTERRLERTGADLQRLDDLIGEVHTQVRSLSRQRGKAERHRQFSEQRFAIVMTATRRELEAFDARHAELQQHREAIQVRIPEARRTIAERERRREMRVQERGAAEARRTELERRLGATRVELERLEGDMNLAVERLEHLSSRRTRAIEERAQAEAKAQQAARELEAAAAERQAAATARASVQTELDLRTASEDEARRRLQQQRERVRELEGALQRTAENSRALSGERTALDGELEELGRQHAEAEERLRVAEQEHGTAREVLEAARSALAAREREEREAGAELERARHALVAAREHEAAVRVERREVEESIAQLSARREALAELERKREGMAPATRALLAAREEFGEGAILGPLSDFLSLTPAEARVTERLLADWLQAVLVRDEATVEAVTAWHARANPGPLVLLPTEPGPSVAPGVAPLELSVTAPAQTWVRALLSGNRAQDPEGRLVRRANGAVFLPGSETTGPLSRRAELDDLGRQLDEANRRLGDLTGRAQQAAEAHSQAERALEAAAEHSTRARAALREAQGASDEASRHLHRAERERAEATQAVARLRERRSERQARRQAVTEEQTAGEAERTRLGEELATQQAVLTDLESMQEAARERRVHWQVEEAQVSARERSAIEREERARQALDEARASGERLTTELADIEGSTGSLTRQRGEWTDTLGERRVAVQEMEEATREAETAVAAAAEILQAEERGLEEARAEADRLNEELHHLELELTEAAGRRRGLTERVEAEWHKPFEALLAEAPEVEGELETLRREAEELARELEQMGPVNPLAVQEHAEEKERLEFLQSQREDLVAARNSLQQALREIDVTAREMFLETFAAVRENFRSVFTTLFEGGECDVRLADENAPLESDIVIQAAPRGKRIQRIHLLSSGERALVAISLLFSIYLTKPAPFCLLDEVDAPLDDANVMRFVRLLEEFKDETQFIVITHNPRTMQVADAVYGVTMQEPGVSTIVGVRLGAAAQTGT
ncbi:MAG: chromosome segregation protein SMC [Gemmatimonadota bacterium]|nr:MAG: chromosome segregation protein SMC [Gemmatimonadota bacterium]